MEQFFKFAIFLILILVGSQAPAGNGSSGVGNGRAQVTSDFTISTLNNSVKVQGSKITDSSTGKVILVYNKIPSSEVTSLIGKGELVTAKLGSIMGLEGVASPSEKKPNYWVLCDTKGDCFKFESKDIEDNKSSSIIGTFGK